MTGPELTDVYEAGVNRGWLREEEPRRLEEAGLVIRDRDLRQSAEAILMREPTDSRRRPL
jgi:hypothetical protein